MQIALVLWDGNVGGAEKMTAELAAALRGIGVDASILFVRDPGPLAPSLDRADIPYESFGTRRVQEVLLRPRRFARAVAERGADGVLLPSVGHLAPALTLGGYRAPVVAMEHGILLLLPRMPLWWRTAHRLERRASARFVDAQVAVSSFMREQLMRTPHARRVEVIENGVDLERYRAAEPREETDCVFGFASRLIDGKGIPELIEAFASVTSRSPAPVRLRLAGDGPERAHTCSLIERHGVAAQTELPGVVADMPRFWRDVDVAVMPSTAPESFGMVALEAMAAGRPVVATRNGGADAVVLDGVTGRLVPCGDAPALAEAMLAYASDPHLRADHGAAAREAAESSFAIARCAERYARLVAELGGRQFSPAPVAAPLEEVNV
jgi:glycosyltransferase involved in cell wall biosynthesis